METNWKLLVNCGDRAAEVETFWKLPGNFLETSVLFPKCEGLVQIRKPHTPGGEMICGGGVLRPDGTAGNNYGVPHSLLKTSGTCSAVLTYELFKP